MKKVNEISIRLKQSYSSHSIRNLLRQRWFVVVLALGLTGLGAALTGVLFKEGIYLLDNWRLNLLKMQPAWLILPALGGIGGLLSGTLISKLSPAAGGSGVTHIMAFLRHRKVPMGLRVGIIKLMAGIISIGSGFPLGPEGPAVQMGGSVAWKMAQWLNAPIAFRRVIVAAGGGAGIAAIFSAPIGGFIYTMEELLHSARPVILLLVVITTFWADTWADVLQAIGLNGHTGGFDQTLGFQIEREYTPLIHFLPIDLGYLIALGIIVGVLAELYCKYVLIMQRKGNQWFKNKLILRMSISGVILGIVYSFLPEEFHHVGELQNLIAIGNANIYLSLGTFVVLFFTTGLAAASKAPGGLFFPMLTLGGCIGSACGTWVATLTGHVPSTYIFAGMGAFVASCSRTPITAMFLAFALTKDLLMLKPVLVACITSFLVAQLINEKSIYERQIEMELNEPTEVENSELSLPPPN
ncbi:MULTISPECIES: ClC family H(+)/Cl(-) exchange transporter [Prochlorococcus]|uniref:Chloride channel protein EriC n=1 Tax=Prochlorococcus marinus (strain SARG / CCMP1375 / SS120) TaxID=167539 RepID=Q7V9G6_PROMA|nr:MULTISPECIES: ClC family H(+)/Cl(-) exchange transporter [Prochlorococcus]AAQ00911.1 Chloride channel protein EriC [Prochlorococcus marinus subsp. marinus str. CCMP1375]KGG10594.1 putative chloride channel [Prochlorococcus marinus str. LG]KGG19940.1 putative chloride channel [Prochlorococcus marinus str. SS2]KGG23840.1 putative chloride channel [Prochlorococcus marinus str. SS35]KGG31900.1 putative chloride channel [Prochlorococcus marinus str. SS51]